MHDAKESLVESQRGRTKSERASRVSQGVGARMACLALVPLAKDDEIKKAIYEIGHMADRLIFDNDGMVFRSFDEAAKEQLKSDG